MISLISSLQLLGCIILVSAWQLVYSPQKKMFRLKAIAGLIAGFIVGYYYQELFDLLSVLLPSLVDLIMKESIAP